MTRFKDANECLKAGVSSTLMMACLTGEYDFAPEKVVAAEAFREAFIQRLLDGEKGEEGLQFPWPFPFRVRRGELTVWTGFEKSGKSTLLDFAIVCLMAQGERALVASFEMKPLETLEKMARQVYGGHVKPDQEVIKRIEGDRNLGGPGMPSKEEALRNYREEVARRGNEVYDWLAPNLWIYDWLGIGDWRQLIADMEWARRRLGITQFVVDNFMMLGIVADDWPAQADAITAFAGAASELDAHIHMVVHQNKEGRKGKSADGAKGTVAGAYQIIARAHNIIEVQRDVRKGQLVDELFQQKEIGIVGAEEFKEKKSKLDLMPDGKMVLHAARNGDRQNASAYLWFLWKAQQYVVHPPGHRDHEPLSFLKQAKQEALPNTGPDLPTSEELGLR